MKQLFLNRWNARERGSSLSFAVLLAMAAMMLSPQKAWADIDVEFSGYADGVITANYDGDEPCDWTTTGNSDPATGNSLVTYSDDSGLTVNVSSTMDFTVLSVCQFTGTLKGIELTMFSEMTDMSVTAQYMDSNGSYQYMSLESGFTYNEDDKKYELSLEDIELSKSNIRLTFNSYSNSGTNQINGWSKIKLLGNLEATVPPTTYDLSVAGVQVTSENASRITGENITGSVSFDAQTNTLTLDDATIIGSEIGGGCILSGLSSLTVKLMGKENQIVSNDSCTAIRATASGNQSLTISADANSMLTITAARIIRDFNSLNVAEDLKWSGEYVYGPFTTDYGNGYALYITGAGEASGRETPITLSNIEYYHLFIGETQVTSENASNICPDFEGTVSYDPENSILTLDAVHLPFGIRTSMENLTIKVRGTNTVYSEGDSAPIAYSGQSNVGGTLTIIKDDTYVDGDCSLNLINYAESGSAITGFGNIVYGEGMSLAAAYGTEYSTTGKYYHNTQVATNVEYVSKVTITSATVYQLWFGTPDGQVQVTSENAGDITGNENESGDVCLYYDVETNTLVFNGFMNEINGNAVGSNLPTLNVALVGNSVMYLGDEYTGFTSYYEDAVLTFKTSDDNPGSLFVQAGTFATGFNDIQYLNDLALKERTDGYGFDIQVPPYGLIVYTVNEPNGVQVTKENCTNVLGEDLPTVQFDGRNRLILNNAQLTRIVLTDPSFLPIVDDQQQLTGMEIYLEGVSTVTCSEGYAIQSQGTAAAVLLEFLTGADKPGTLECTGTDNPFQGFNVTYKNNLTLTQNSMTATVETPLLLIVENTVDDEEYIYNSNPGGSDNAQLQNFITTDRKVLFTLGDNGVANKSDDGYDQTRQAIIFNYVTTDTDVAAINTDEKVPGTLAYAGAFTGITFIVPAGTGTIKLKAHTETDATGYYAFHVMVGNQEPVEVVNTSGYNWIEVPYACTTDSYVKVYLVYVDKSSAPMMASHRIGPKSHVSGGLGGMSVSSSLVCSTDAQAVTAPYKIMAAGDWNKTENHITVSASDVTDMADNAFGFAGSSAPVMNARRASADHVTYIDCSKTSITGKNFTRTEGAFQGVPEETLIYLPAGNTAVGKNFVIGGICENMKLDADLEADFELTDEELTAARAEFTREFNKSTGAQNCYTVYLPYEMNVSNLVGRFFEFSSYNETEEKVVMTEVSAYAADMLKLEANKAYLFRPSGNGKLPAMNGVTVKMPVQVSNPSAATEAEGMHGVYKYHKWTTAPDNIYCYSASAKDDIKAGQFAKVGKDTFIRPFRAYLRLNTTSAPEYLSVNWGDGTTSIVPIDKTMVQQDADGWFTISGFRLPDKPSKQGVYIHNGKKIVMK